MAIGLTPSEKFINFLCELSFLKLWTHPNPTGKKGKELCDCIIVCEPHVIMISVKDIEYKDTGDETGWERWIKRAVSKSLDQLNGAERWLDSQNEFKNLLKKSIKLPQKDIRKYHRVAVTFGGKRSGLLEMPMPNDKWYHILDEISAEILFRTLDTITDFTRYLDWAEKVNEDRLIFIEGGNEYLLALYFHDKYEQINIKDNQEPIVIEHGFAENFYTGDFFINMHRQTHQTSMFWDNLINALSENLLNGEFFDALSEEVTENQIALITMVKEDRVSREVLSSNALDFLKMENRNIISRGIKGPSGVVYMFLVRDSSDAERRRQELTARCLVARGKTPGVEEVVGIAIDPEDSENSSLDLLHLLIREDEWDEEDDRIIKIAQEDLGIYSDLD